MRKLNQQNEITDEEYHLLKYIEFSKPEKVELSQFNYSSQSR